MAARDKNAQYALSVYLEALFPYHYTGTEPAGQGDQNRGRSGVKTELVFYYEVSFKRFLRQLTVPPWTGTKKNQFLSLPVNFYHNSR